MEDTARRLTDGVKAHVSSGEESIEGRECHQSGEAMRKGPYRHLGDATKELT